MSHPLETTVSRFHAAAICDRGLTYFSDTMLTRERQLDFDVNQLFDTIFWESLGWGQRIYLMQMASGRQKASYQNLKTCPSSQVMKVHSDYRVRCEFKIYLYILYRLEQSGLLPKLEEQHLVSENSWLKTARKVPRNTGLVFGRTYLKN